LAPDDDPEASTAAMKTLESITTEEPTIESTTVADMVSAWNSFVEMFNTATPVQRDEITEYVRKTMPPPMRAKLEDRLLALLQGRTRHRGTQAKINGLRKRMRADANNQEQARDGQLDPRIVSDEKHPDMCRILKPDGSRTDIMNSTRAQAEV